MKTILCASDLSPRSDRAVARATALARDTGARLILLTVLDSDLPGRALMALMAEAERHLGGQAAEARAEMRVLHGDAAPAILKTAMEAEADLLVLGTHRPRLIADLVMETCAERIVRACACPVLVVVAPPGGPYRSIVAAVDFSPAATAAIRAAAALAPGAPIHAVHALHVPLRERQGIDSDVGRSFRHAAEAERDRWAAQDGLPPGMAPVEIVEGGAHGVVASAIARRGADLLALGAHARSGLHLMTLGSFARDMLRDPPCDLLIARDTGA